MNLETIALIFTWVIVIPVLVLFPPKATWLRHNIKKQRNLRNVRSAILDANWLVKQQPQSQLQSQQKETAAAAAAAASSLPPRWSVPRNRTCILVFCNPRSGGQLGDDLLATLKKVLSPRQVFDLSSKAATPQQILSAFDADSNVRILCAGGDGTVSWVLSSCVAARRRFPIGVLPLGTGNDLAISYGWGTGCTAGDVTVEAVVDVCARVLASPVAAIDRWTVEFTPLSKESSKSKSNNSNSNKSDSAYKNVINEKRSLNMLNYFSVGIDAAICERFHTQRDEAPCEFSSQAANKLRYARLGFEQSFDSQPLDDKVCNLRGSDNQLIATNPAHKCLMISSSTSYQGKDFWAQSDAQEPDEFTNARSDDGRLECMAIAGCLHFGLVHLSTSWLQLDNAVRVAQDSSFEITLTEAQPVQLDGEPFVTGPCVVRFSCSDQFPLLRNIRTTSANWWQW